MIEIICTIISGIFALISAIFGGITIYTYRINKRQNAQTRGVNSPITQIGEYNDSK